MTSMSEVITDRLPNTALLAMWLASLAVSRPPPIAPWPSPHLSLGKKCSPFGSKECWEVSGPAQVISSDLFSAVKTLLDSRVEYLYEREPKPCYVMFGLYMIGDDGAHASPTLLLSCERKVPRRKALKLVKESGILSKHPGVRLAESIRSPLVIQAPVFLAGAEEYLHESVDEPDTVYWSPSKFTCGIPVHGRERTGVDSSWYKATIGGVVYLDGKAYGLSTAHNFQREDLHTSVPDDEIDFEFAYGDLEESDSFDETSEISDTSDTSILSKSSKSPTQMSQSQAHIDPFGTYVPLGIVKRTSLDSGNIGSDWALVELRSLKPVAANTVSYRRDSHIRHLPIKSIVQTGPAERKVLAITGYNGIIRGMMSNIPTFMMLPGGNSFEEVWTVTFKDGSVERGDCGSWIVDDETGDLYGHIVAGSPESSVAFMIPALAIQSEMKQHFGSDWTLPQNTLSSKVQDDIQPTKEAQMIMLASHESHDERESELTGSKAKQSSDFDTISRDTKSQPHNERLSQEDGETAFQKPWSRKSFPTAWSPWGWNATRKRYSRYRQVAETGDSDRDFEFEYDPKENVNVQTPTQPDKYSPDPYTYTPHYTTPPVVQDIRGQLAQVGVGYAASGNTSANPQHIGTEDPSRTEEPPNRNFRLYSSRAFQFGRVFEMLWTEPIGSNGTVITDSIQAFILRGKMFTSIRRFVVIEPLAGHCICLPIITYGGKATLKSGVKPEDHTIIYTSERPIKKEGEQLANKPLRMIPDTSREKLDSASRINYAKLYTVEHNVEVHFIGQIAPKHLQQLWDDYLRTHGITGSAPSYAIPQDQTTSYAEGSNWQLPNTNPASSASMPRNSLAIAQYQQAQVAAIRPTLQVVEQPRSECAVQQLMELPASQPHVDDETLYMADD